MNDKKQHRTTIVLPESVEKNLHQLCLLFHLSKSSVISLLIDRETDRRMIELSKLREKQHRGYCEVID
jgi:hypothetical protein